MNTNFKNNAVKINENIFATTVSFNWLISDETTVKLYFSKVKKDTLEFLETAALAAGGYSQLDWALIAQLVRGQYNNGRVFLNADVMFDFMAERFEWSGEIYELERDHFETVKNNMNWMASSNHDKVFVGIYNYAMPEEHCPEIYPRQCQTERVW